MADEIIDIGMDGTARPLEPIAIEKPYGTILIDPITKKFVKGTCGGAMATGAVRKPDKITLVLNKIKDELPENADEGREALMEIIRDRHGVKPCPKCKHEISFPINQQSVIKAAEIVFGKVVPSQSFVHKFEKIVRTDREDDIGQTLGIVKENLQLKMENSVLRELVVSLGGKLPQ